MQNLAMAHKADQVRESREGSTIVALNTSIVYSKQSRIQYMVKSIPETK